MPAWIVERPSTWRRSKNFWLFSAAIHERVARLGRGFPPFRDKATAAAERDGALPGRRTERGRSDQGARARQPDLVRRAAVARPRPRAAVRHIERRHTRPRLASDWLGEPSGGDRGGRRSPGAALPRCVRARVPATWRATGIAARASHSVRTVSLQRFLQRRAPSCSMPAARRYDAARPRRSSSSRLDAAATSSRPGAAR